MHLQPLQLLRIRNIFLSTLYTCKHPTGCSPPFTTSSFFPSPYLLQKSSSRIIPHVSLTPPLLAHYSPMFRKFRLFEQFSTELSWAKPHTQHRSMHCNGGGGYICLFKPVRIQPAGLSCIKSLIAHVPARALCCSGPRNRALASAVNVNCVQLTSKCLFEPLHARDTT